MSLFRFNIVLALLIVAFNSCKDDNEDLHLPTSIVAVGDAPETFDPKPDNIQRFAVQALDNKSKPSPGVVVLFTTQQTITGEHGVTSTRTTVASTTDGDGVAFLDQDLGKIESRWDIEASVPGLDETTIVEWGFMVTSSVVKTLELVSGDKQVKPMDIRDPDNITIRALDEFGNPVQKAIVAFSKEVGDGTLSDNVSTTDQDGIAKVRPNFGSEAVTRFTAFVGNVKTSFEFYTVVPVIQNKPQVKDDLILVSWTANLNPSAEKIEVWKQPQHGSLQSIDLPPDQTSFEDHDVQLGESYTYSIHAYVKGKFGYSYTYSNEFKAKVGNPVAFPNTSAPRYAAFDRNNNIIYFNLTGKWINKISTNPVLKRDSIPTSFSAQVLAVSTNSDKLYASNAKTIYVLNPNNGNVITSYDLSAYGTTVSDMYPLPTGELIVVINNKVLFLAADGTVTTNISASKNGANHIIGFIQPYVYVSIVDYDEISRFDITDPANVIYQREDGTASSYISNDGSTIYLSTGLSLSLPDFKRNETFSSCSAMYLSPDNQKLYTIDQDKIEIIDPVTLGTTATVPIFFRDNPAKNIFVSSDGSYAIVLQTTNYPDYTTFVYKIQLP